MKSVPGYAGLALGCFLLTVFGLAIFLIPRPPLAEAYWIWAGIPPRDVPQSAILYAYQGVFDTHYGATRYERIGLAPHPVHAHALHLVYRLTGDLPPPDVIMRGFARDRLRWKTHDVAVAGLQLDFDAPTAKLGDYAGFLNRLRHRLPQGTGLSVTGLGDWARHGSRADLAAISDAVDDIVFQLYRGRAPLSDIGAYINDLRDYPHPFQIGLLHRAPKPDDLGRLAENVHFRGVIYFIQR